MKWAIQAKEEEKNKPQTFRADGWMDGESKIFTNVVKKWARTPLSRAKNSKNKWAEWLGRGRGKGIRGPRSFVPVGDTNRDKRLRGPFVLVEATNRDKRPPFCPGWCLQPAKKALAPLSPSLSPARAIQLTCSYCSWLGRGEFLLISSPHLWRSLIPQSIHWL